MGKDEFSSHPHYQLAEFELSKRRRSSGSKSTEPIDESVTDNTSTTLRYKIKPKLLKTLLVLFIAAIIFCVYLYFSLRQVFPEYRVSSSYKDEYQYSFLLKPHVPKARIMIREVMTELNLLPTLNVSIQCYTPNHFRLVINDSDTQRWEIPYKSPYPFVANPKPCRYNDAELEFHVQEKPFTLKITRKATKEVIFDIGDTSLLFSKYLLQVENKLSSFDFFGFGERLYKLQMGPGEYTIWPKDIPADVETGQPGHNNYGQQPVYLLREPAGNYHIVLLRNANAMEIKIKEDRSVTYQVVGGIMDFHIFVGSKDPEAIIQTYHEYLGNWTIPPFWSMGYHQSRWGYNYVYQIEEVLKGYKDNKIPLDVIWSDIDYMKNHLDFTIDTFRFPVNKFTNVLKTYDKKWVPIIDAGIGTSMIMENEAYRKGKKLDLFVKNKDGKDLMGYVWPGDSVYPDFFHPAAEDYWVEMCGVLNKIINYDGIWLDMNEVSNFCHGECGRKDFRSSDYYNLPFVPGITNLSVQTISLDAVHYGNISEFDAHSLFNILQQKATYKYLKTKSPLPFILTRANVFGSGQYSSHWFGDTKSDWLSMRYTIASLISYNMFGMPHSGADICGFMQDTTPELCARWTQLGIFYPFARNHHELNSKPQEPYRFAPQYMTPMVDAIKYRYSILKHFYTLFVSKNGTGTIIKPLYFEFPDDTSLFRGKSSTAKRVVEEQFMLGKSIMVTPILHQGESKTNAYFPDGAWYNLETFECVRLPKNSRFVDIVDGKLPPNFLRGGWILMMQNILTVSSTKDLNNEFNMVVALPEEKNAKTSEDASFRTLNSTGEILDVASYEEDVIYQNCLMKDCLLKTNVEFGWNKDKNRVTIAISAMRRDGTVKQAGRGISIKELKVLGDGIKDLDATSWKRFEITKDHDDTFKVKTDRIKKEKDALVIQFENPLWLEGGSVFRLKHDI